MGPMPSVSKSTVAHKPSALPVGACKNGWSGPGCDVPPLYSPNQSPAPAPSGPQVSLWDDVAAPVLASFYPPTAFAEAGQEVERVWRERDVNGGMLDTAMMVGSAAAGGIVNKKANALKKAGSEFLTWVWGKEKPLQEKLAKTRAATASRPIEKASDSAELPNPSILPKINTLTFNYRCPKIRKISEEAYKSYRNEIKAMLEHFEQGAILAAGADKIENLKGVFELRHVCGARVFLTRTGEKTYDVLAMMPKGKQKQVIALLRPYYPS
ncbi:MAG: hypothetical protein IPK79_02590 [Vampirovibrionales bacterium]|nr:hypothetical protein [Vampirovibrionales bacterium]